MKIALTSGNNWLKDNEYSLEEEKEIYFLTLEDIYNNPRWYLDNLEYLVEYRVSFINYKTKKETFIK
jgi:hypothetical protein